MAVSKVLCFLELKKPLSFVDQIKYTCNRTTSEFGHGIYLHQHNGLA